MYKVYFVSGDMFLFSEWEGGARIIQKLFLIFSRVGNVRPYVSPGQWGQPAA